jgi:hypothetical protein
VLATLVEDAEPEDLSSLTAALNVVAQPKRVGIIESKPASQETKEVKALRDKVQELKVVSRAKVTQNRIYSAAYHPEITKDLIFFGGEIICERSYLFLCNNSRLISDRQEWPTRHMGRPCASG